MMKCFTKSPHQVVSATVTVESKHLLDVMVQLSLESSINTLMFTVWKP